MKNRIIIAEIGSVHDGSFGNALKLIDSAAKSGSDYVKFQTHIAEAESLENAPNPSYFSNESRMEYFKRTSFNIDQWKKLKQRCDEREVGFISSPFSLESVDLLEEVGVSLYKIPSGEISNSPLLEKVAKTRKPVLISSGMSNWNELDDAISIFEGNCDVVVMQCSSIYPCPNSQVGLNVIKEMISRYSCQVGFSDHTLGMSAAIGAVALGATAVEKHFTFSREMYGSDAKHSMEPNEFREFCNSVRDMWEILDNPVDKDDIAKYDEMRLTFQKSIIARESLSAGTVLEYKHMSFKKPGSGISAKNYRNIIGKKLTKPIKKNEMFSVDFLE